MTGGDFLNLASLLFAPFRSGAKPIGEALGRTIVSRCYYAAYHLAVAHLKSLGLQPGNDHGTPKCWFQACSETEAKKIGRLLDDLYSARWRADYLLDDPKAIRELLNAQFIEQKIEWAADVSGLLENCGKEPARSLVLADIQSFQQRMKRQ